MCPERSRVRIYRGTTLQTLRPAEKEGKAGLQAPEPVVLTVVRQLRCCSTWRSMGVKRSPCSLWKRLTGAGTVFLSRTVNPCEAHDEQAPGRALHTHGERSPRWSSLSLQSAPHGRVTHIGEVHEVLLPVRWTNAGEVHGELYSYGRDPSMEQGKGSSLWTVAGTMCDELAITLIPCLPAPLRGGGIAGKEGLRKGVFRILIYFLLSCSAFLLLLINSVNIPKSSLFCLQRFAEWSLSILISTHEPSYICLLSSCGVKGSNGVALVGAWNPANINPLQVGIPFKQTSPASGGDQVRADIHTAAPGEQQPCQCCAL